MDTYPLCIELVCGKRHDPAAASILQQRHGIGCLELDHHMAAQQRQVQLAGQVAPVTSRCCCHGCEEGCCFWHFHDTIQLIQQDGTPVHTYARSAVSTHAMLLQPRTLCSSHSRACSSHTLFNHLTARPCVSVRVLQRACTVNPTTLVTQHGAGCHEQGTGTASAPCIVKTNLHPLHCFCLPSGCSQQVSCRCSTRDPSCSPHSLCISLRGRPALVADHDGGCCPAGPYEAQV